MKNKKLIAIMSFIVAAVLIAFAMNMQKEKTYSLDYDADVRLAVEDVLDLSLPKDKACYIVKEDYTYGKTTYCIGGINDDNKLYYVLFKKQKDGTYLNVCEGALNGTDLIEDENNETFIVVGYYDGEGSILEMTLNYKDGTQKKEEITVYHNIIKFISDSDLESIELSEGFKYMQTIKI